MSTGYIIHKAVSVDNCRKTVRDVLSRPGWLEEHYIAQPKYDGCNMLVQIYEVEGERRFSILSRTNETVRSCDHIGLAMLGLESLDVGVYLGECWCPDLPFNEISGLFRRQTGDVDTCRLQFAVFDYLTWEEWSAGESKVGYANRVARIADVLSMIPQAQAPVWSAGSFGIIAETWKNTTAQDVCNKLVDAGGYDGLILRDPDGEWRAGDSGKDGEIIKIKRKLSFDLRIIGMEEGKGKNKGRLGALVVSFKGQELRVGTGFTDVSRNEWFNFPGRSPVGLIAEIEAMDYSSDGLLREPRFKGIRIDKVEPDA